MTNEFKIKKGLIVTGSGGTLLDVQGSVGQVFSVTDSLTGDIFSVSDVSGIPIFNVNSDGTVTIDGNIQLADNDKIQLGDSQDLELYHDGTDSLLVDNGTGVLKFFANGNPRFQVGSDVHVLTGTDFAIAAGRKLYLDGQSNTYITESSSDTIKIFTGGTEVLQLADNAATFAGNIKTAATGGGTGILMHTNSGISINSNLMQFWTGQSSGYKFYANSTGDETNELLHLDASGNATFAGTVTAPQHFKASGNNISFWAGATHVLNIDLNRKIYPNTDNSTDLGFSATQNRFRHGYFTGSMYVGDNFIMTGVHPTISFLDNDTNADDFYIHVNSNNFYVLTNRTDSEVDTVDTGWEAPHPLQLEADTNIGYLFGERIFNGGYHPNADIWTTARTITLAGDLSGSVSINGSADVTLTAAVSNDSHTHDGRYYTETEINNKFTSTDGSGNEWKFKLGDEGNLSGNKWYKVAQVNQGNGGLQIKGFLGNHVETFGTQQFDLAIQGRETNTEIEITGVVNVLHNATGATATDKVGIRVVKSDTTSNANWHYWDVYIRTARYTQADIHIIKSGTGTSFYTTKPSVTSEPAPVSGGTVEIDTSTYAEGNYMISNSSPVLTAKTTGTTVVGTLTAEGDVIAYSDLSLKENIKTLDGSKVLQMRGVSFNRKNNGILSSGVIAQEMQKVAPELVSDDNGTLGVAYGNLTGYLIEAIKDLKQEVEQLKKQIK